MERQGCFVAVKKGEGGRRCSLADKNSHPLRDLILKRGTCYKLILIKQSGINQAQ
jgi:hypothetical protein